MVLYVFDNETNTVVKISVFIGLLIEIWKIHKVVNVKVSIIPDKTYLFVANYIKKIVPFIKCVKWTAYCLQLLKLDVIL